MYVLRDLYSVGSVETVFCADLGNIKQEKSERGVLSKIYMCADLDLSLL